MKEQGKNAKKYDVMSGQQYGPYVALCEIERVNEKSIERLWKVRHIITEKERIMRPSYLIIVQNRYNKVLETENYQNGLKTYLFNQCIRGAKIRNHEFNLTFGDFIKIITNNCHYCGELPKKSSSKILINRGHINEPPFYYNGIDRIDSKLNYDVDNCVPCCSTCNYMKHTLDEGVFVNQIKKIHNHLKLS
jgi:hypothetical protein